jgi:penicillin-insensitive murein endopeptidase
VVGFEVTIDRVRHPRRYLACLLLITCTSTYAESICYGTTSKGKIEGSVQLPREGTNFSSYSDAGVTLGRTYVHAKVAEVVAIAYRELAKSHPDVRFVYGETGWKSGGSFKPHRTHQNGLSVDFFVPVRDAAGRSVPLPTNITNKFGYDIEFDAKGKFGEYTIDFEAIAEHLYQLDQAAKKLNAPIKIVILDPPYLPKLFATKRGEYAKANIKFMERKAWVRHDDHYHIDFAVPCKPLK